MVFGAFGDIIVYSLEFVEDILYRLHHDGLQRARERVGVIRIVLPQHERRLCLLLDGLAARLSLQDEIRDRELGRGRGGPAFGRVVVFFPDVVEQPADGVSDRMFCNRFIARASFYWNNDKGM
jgi:hypothetical protein